MATWDFIKQFCKAPRVIGAVAPSSNGLAEKMTQRINFNNAHVIVEYGPGSGVFTKHIAAHINTRKTTFFALELNETMNRLVSEQVSEVTIYQDSASSVNKYLKNLGKKADAIVSGLPWALFPESLQDEILKETFKALRKGGTFSTFAYIHGTYLPSGKRMRKKLIQHFNKVETSKIIWKNIPPALVYYCTK